MLEAVMFANLFCAQAHPKGSTLSGGKLVSAFTSDGEIGKFLQEIQAATDAKGVAEKAD